MIHLIIYAPMLDNEHFILPNNDLTQHISKVVYTQVNSQTIFLFADELIFPNAFFYQLLKQSSFSFQIENVWKKIWLFIFYLTIVWCLKIDKRHLENIFSETSTSHIRIQKNLCVLTLHIFNSFWLLKTQKSNSSSAKELQASDTKLLFSKL